MKILVLNSGSSSEKISLYEIRDRLPESPSAPVWEGRIEFRNGHARVQIVISQGHTVRDAPVGSCHDAVQALLNQLWSGPAPAIRESSEVDVVGHRIVNGGKQYEEPTLITPALKAAITDMAAFAPLHNRAELDGIKIIEHTFGSVPQVAVFDTGFHRRIPEAAAIYPGPYDWLGEGIRRYGFHGINHQYCAERSAQLLAKDLNSLKLVTCHLGNGCSLAAIRDGHSVDTTMGFTPLEGLMMGTRSGSVDPGILTFLMRRDSLTAQQLDELLNTKSGLLGISGISSDMREVLSAMKEGNSRAKLAFDIFVHRLRSCIGSMVASLGGLDALVFTAGIGENSSQVRTAVCANLGFLGVKLDFAKNAQLLPDQDISMPGAAVRVLIVKAQEDWAIAQACWRLISHKALH